MTGVRLPDSLYWYDAWRIHEIAPDFVVEDVWALPVHGDAEDFRGLVELMASSGPANAGSLRPTHSGGSATAGRTLRLGRIAAPAEARVDQGEGRPDGRRYQGRMAVLVKPRGRLGEVYLALIRPFRHDDRLTRPSCARSNDPGTVGCALRTPRDACRRMTVVPPS